MSPLPSVFTKASGHSGSLLGLGGFGQMAHVFLLPKAWPDRG